ncbi:reverse transcriptase domain-containing protein, partial [Tanacetum coccineum]
MPSAKEDEYEVLARATTQPQVGEMTGGWTGRGGGRTRGRSGDQSDGRNDGQGGQGNGRNQNDDAANDNTQGNVSRGCTYKEFLACNPKESDGKGGMSWEDFKTLTREEFCPSNEIQKLETELWNHAMVRAGHAAYTDRFHELARLVLHLVTLEGKKIKRYVYGLASQIQGMVAATEPKTIQKAVQIAGTLTDEALRNGSIKRTLRREEMEGNLARIGIRSFDVIIGMDWLSDHKAEIICHEKVSRIPLLDGKVLRVLGEKPEGTEAKRDHSSERFFQ